MYANPIWLWKNLETNSNQLNLVAHLLITKSIILKTLKIEVFPSLHRLHEHFYCALSTNILTCRMKIRISTVCFITVLVLPVLSSYGDQTHEYRDCVTMKMRTCEYGNLDTTLKVSVNVRPVLILSRNCSCRNKTVMRGSLKL